MSRWPAWPAHEELTKRYATRLDQWGATAWRHHSPEAVASSYVTLSGVADAHAKAAHPDMLTAVAAMSKEAYATVVKADQGPHERARRLLDQLDIEADPSEGEGILNDLHAESWDTGAAAAEYVLGGSDGDFVVPNRRAVDALRPDQFQQLLSSAGVTIRDINDVSLERMANVLADGVANGDSVDTIAKALADVVGTDRAELIARTEVARGMSAAAVASYKEAGIEQVDWLTADLNVSDECGDLRDGSPYSLDEVDPPPAHPGCLCALVAHFDGDTADTPDDASESQDDAGNDAEKAARRGEHLTLAALFISRANQVVDRRLAAGYLALARDHRAKAELI